MSSRVARGGRFVARLAAGTILAVGFATFGVAVWPHDEVRISGDAVLLSPGDLPVGGTVVFQRGSFCNDGVDTMVARWADLFVDGRRVAAFSLPPVQFFTSGEPMCVEPSVSTIVLPDYIPAGEYRLRFITSWEPGGLAATQQVETVTPLFRIGGGS